MKSKFLIILINDHFDIQFLSNGNIALCYKNVEVKLQNNIFSVYYKNQMNEMKIHEKNQIDVSMNAYQYILFQIKLQYNNNLIIKNIILIQFSFFYQITI